MGLGLFNYLMFFHPPCLRTDFNCPFENVRVSLKLAVSQSQDDLETFSTSVRENSHQQLAKICCTLYPFHTDTTLAEVPQHYKTLCFR